MDSPGSRDEREGGGRPLGGPTPALDPPTLRRRLLAFFDARARDLPWRRTDDPYAIWVSEVMLQQTRVETVVPYWRRWMERWPDAASLAAADPQDVLKAWEGLGYYRRARMLHAAAAVVRDRHGGGLPRDVESLRALPGVGAYTAGAVASIAFGRPEPAVDGNVRRVLARVYDLPRPTAGQLRDLAAGLVDRARPGDFNQALMELGATVCLPRSPRCGECPLAAGCTAREEGTQERRPLPAARKPVPEVDVGVAVVTRPAADGEVEAFLVRRPVDGLLGGLWEFPGETPKDEESVEGAAARAARRCGGPPEGSPRPLVTVDHAYSHFRARYAAALFEAPGDSSGGDASDPAGGWFALDALDALPLSVAQRRIATRAVEVVLDGA